MKKKKKKVQAQTNGFAGWMDGWMEQNLKSHPLGKSLSNKLTKTNLSYPLLTEHYTQPPLGCKPQPKQIITC